jgi:hypothetical protein
MRSSPEPVTLAPRSHNAAHALTLEKDSLAVFYITTTASTTNTSRFTPFIILCLTPRSTRRVINYLYLGRNLAAVAATTTAASYTCLPRRFRTSIPVLSYGNPR